MDDSEAARLRLSTADDAPTAGADVTEDSHQAAESTPPPRAHDRLDSWKAIAAYLKRDVTTVRRWEKREGLPVHRHLHERRDSVYAYTEELDRWLSGRRNGLADATWAGPSSVAPETESQIESGRRWRASLPWMLASVLLVVTLLLAGVLVRDRARDGRASSELRFLVAPPDAAALVNVALSADGRLLAFTASPRSGAGTSMLWVRALDQIEARVLPETEGAAFPFSSPRGDALGFFSGGHLWIVSLDGGAPRRVADAPHAAGGSWSRDDVILFAPDRDGPLALVPAGGGAVTTVTTVTAPDERGHMWPQFLPDGRRFLYFANSSRFDDLRLMAGALEGNTRQVLIPRATSNAVYGAGGFLFFAEEHALVARPFDPGRLAFTGDAVTVADTVHQSFDVDYRLDLAVAETAVVSYRSRLSPDTRLTWRTRERTTSVQIETPAEYSEPVVSPDDARIAVALFDPRPSRRFGYGPDAVRSDIVIVDRATGAIVRETSDPAADWGPVWSPDGTELVFSSNRRDGNLELYRTVVGDEGNDELLLAAKDSYPVAQSWSADGRFIVYAAFDPRRRTDLWLLPMAGDRTPVPLVASDFSETQGQISPDGRWLAYVSDESGRFEVYVQRFPDAGEKRRVSTEGGGDPRWSRDGRELFYIAADRLLMSIAVTTNGPSASSAPRPLFETGVPADWYYARNLYDVSRDGRFLFMSPVQDDRLAPFTVIVNPAALQR